MMFLLGSLCWLGVALAQKADTAGPNAKVETPPTIAVQSCTKSGCSAETCFATLDANWRQVLDPRTGNNCFEDDKWDATLCSDPNTCASTCALAGLTEADYASLYGITTTADGGLQLKYVNAHESIGSRLYLMDTDNSYKMFRLKNKEIAFDVVVSQLPCGLNGALYLASMSQDGGKGLGSNSAGAKYGTGYCDAQCPHDLHFINGEPNVLNWDSNSKTGHFGSCCTEVDLWEANKMSTSYTMHPCTSTEPFRCEGTQCGDTDKGERYQGLCDKDGCDFNPYRLGDHTFYGPGLTVDTSRPMTVVTQFLTADGTDIGELSEIKRFYMQDGVVIPNSESRIAGVQGNSITDAFCAAEKQAFAESSTNGGINDFANKGGLQKMGEALDRGMVLVMSVWDDRATDMDWLDSNSPKDLSGATPGVKRGACTLESGIPENVRAQYPDSSVTFSNIRYGEIGSTAGVTGVLSSRVVYIKRSRIVLLFKYIFPQWLKDHGLQSVLVFMAAILLVSLVVFAIVMLLCPRARPKRAYHTAPNDPGMAVLA